MRLAIDIGALVVTAIGTALGLWTLLTPGDPPQLVLAICLGTIASGAIALAFVLLRTLHREEMRGARAKKWSRAMTKVSQAIRHLSDSAAVAHHEDDEARKRAFGDHAKDACSALSNAFGQVTGHECRVTLLETFHPGGRTSNEPAVKRLYSTDGRHSTTAQTDWVSENTDFDEIFKGADFFFSNDLATDLKAGYRNSHWTRAKVQEMQQSGRYPYRSTIVWPVGSTVALDGVATDVIVGFLCVDSQEPGAFDASIDMPIGEIVARGMFAVWPSTELPQEEVEKVQE